MVKQGRRRCAFSTMVNRAGVGLDGTPGLAQGQEPRLRHTGAIFSRRAGRRRAYRRRTDAACPAPVQRFAPVSSRPCAGSRARRPCHGGPKRMRGRVERVGSRDRRLNSALGEHFEQLLVEFARELALPRDGVGPGNADRGGGSQHQPVRRDLRNAAARKVDDGQATAPRQRPRARLMGR